MPRTKVLFTVLLSSPADVENERKIVAKIIDEINNIHKNSNYGIILKSWEKDISPSIIMNPGQVLIDEEFHYEESDMLIGIFCKKLGTPVFESESGTVHEINKAINSYKKYGTPDIKLYFKKVNINISSMSNFEIEQYERLVSKKRDYMKIGIVKSYNTIKDFEESCRMDILKFLNKRMQEYDKRTINFQSPNIVSIKTRKNFERMEKILDPAKEEIFIIGINLEGALNVIDFLLYKAELGVKIKLIALCPEDNLLSYFNMNEISVIEKKNKIISNLKILVDKLSVENVTIKLINRIFTAGCIGIDINAKGRIIAQQYLNNVGTSLAPILDICEDNKDLYAIYKKYINNLWNISDIYIGEKRWI